MNSPAAATDRITADWLLSIHFTGINDTEYRLGIGNNEILVDLLRGEVAVSVAGHTYHPTDGTVHFPHIQTQYRLAQLITLLQA